MAELRLTRGGPPDVSVLLPLIAQFYVHFGYPFSEPVKRRVLAQLIANPALGLILVISLDENAVGYAIVVFSFSLEHGGRVALVDELFVVPGSRSRGIGRAALAHIETLCRDLGFSALQMETEISNTRASGLYRQLGFLYHGRTLLTKRLTKPEK